MAKSTRSKAQMPDRVSVLVADDILYSLGGKAYLNGVYLNDIAIPVDQVAVPQLVFMFAVTVDIEQQFEAVTLEVALPGSEPAQSQIVNMPVPLSSEKRSLSYYWPFFYRSPILRPGKIEARVKFNKRQIEANALWIVRVPATGNVSTGF